MTSAARAEHYRLHAEICKVLTEPKRLALLDALRDGEQGVGALAQAVGISLPNASQHLGIMRAAGLVDARRDGITVRYRLAEPAIIEACAVIDGIIERRLTARPSHLPPPIDDPRVDPSPARSTASSAGAGA